MGNRATKLSYRTVNFDRFSRPVRHHSGRSLHQKQLRAGLIGGDPSSVTVGLGSRQSSGQLALLVGISTTGWTTNTDYQFEVKLLFHGDRDIAKEESTEDGQF
jgi:hypothetical protein